MPNLLNHLLFVDAGDDDLGACLKANAHLDAGQAFDACSARRRAALKGRMALELAGIASLALGALLVVWLATSL